jgi:hypothetical protein
MSDLNTQVLIDIRNELREMRGDIRGTNERLDRTNERLDRSVQEQIRLATTLVAVEVGQREMKEEIRGLNARIDNVLIGPMGTTVKEHESRIRRVEEHLGLAGPSK